MTNTIHQGGSKAKAHLNHPGRMVNPKIPSNYFVSSTAKACENGGAMPTVLDFVGLEKVKNLFVQTSIRAKKAGFDYIELQFGHGYLLSQFISKAVNNRKDEYGGSFENRIKFPLEIIARISGDEMTPNGNKIDEMQEFSKILAKKGVNAIHVSAGTACSIPPWFLQHMFALKPKLGNWLIKLEKLSIFL